MSGLRVERFGDVARFYQIVEPMLLREEAENNLILGVAGKLRDEPVSEKNFFAIAFDNETPVLAAMMTHLHSLIVTRGPDAALDAIADFAIQTKLHPPAVSGPVDAARRVAELMAKRVGQTANVHTAFRIFQCDRVIPPPKVSGYMRVANESDAAIIFAWLEQFRVECNLLQMSSRDVMLERLKAGQFFLWEDGQPVSLAALSVRTPRGVRINGVFTPPHLRGRGYASNCVAGLTRHLLETDRKICFLYTDLSNPTSNKIYQQIGYRPECDCTEFTWDK